MQNHNSHHRPYASRMSSPSGDDDDQDYDQRQQHGTQHHAQQQGRGSSPIEIATQASGQLSGTGGNVVIGHIRGGGSSIRTPTTPYAPIGSGPTVHLRAPLAESGGSSSHSAHSVRSSISSIDGSPPPPSPSLVVNEKDAKKNSAAASPASFATPTAASAAPAAPPAGEPSGPSGPKSISRTLPSTATTSSSTVTSSPTSSSSVHSYRAPVAIASTPGSIHGAGSSSGGGADMFSPLSDGGGSQHTPLGEGGGGGYGLRSRSRSKSPHSVDFQSRLSGSTTTTISDAPNKSGGGGGSRSRDSSIAIHINDHPDSSSAPKPAPKSALKRAVSAASVVKRRRNDRLPLYRDEVAAKKRSAAAAAAASSSGVQQLHYSQALSSQGNNARTSNAHQHQHHQNHSGIGPTSLNSTWLTHAAILLTIFYVMLDSKSKVDVTTSQLRYYREEEDRVNTKIVEFESRARQLGVEVERLRRDNDVLEELREEQLAKLDRLTDEQGVVKAIEKERTKILARDEMIRNQVRILQQRIQTESRREASQKFGHGPHRIEMALEFIGQPKRDDGGNLLPYKFQIEMASLMDMPHSVQLFLEQIHHGLWDGCAFVWNPDHLVLASPHVHAEEMDDGTLEIFEDDEKREDFVETGYTSVSFQEYSSKFPHRQYTLGFAGRPGGPNFYINMKDNSRVHGPDGRTANLETDDDGDADPCFARVVAGFDAVDRMHSMPVKNEGSGWQRSAFKDDVFIRYAKILPSKKK